MRTRLILPAFLLTTLILPCLPAAAQVSVDPRALEPLQKGDAAPPAQHPAPQHPAARTRTESKPAAKTPARPAGNTTVRTNSGTTPPQPAVPAAPPPTVNLPPPIVVPMRPVQPAAPAAVSPDAPGEATAMQGGLRVSFGSGRSDLNPATETAIRTLVRGTMSIPATPDSSSYTITSFAAGTPEDPSTARRLSLSRALALRSVLISQGVASVRIYVKALGPASPGFADGPADRADITVATNPVPPPATAAASKPK